MRSDRYQFLENRLSQMQTFSTSIKQWQDRKKCIENLGLHNRTGARGAGGAGLPLLSHRFATKRNTKASRPLLGRGLSSTYLFRRSHGRYKIFWQSLSKGMRASSQKVGKNVFVNFFCICQRSADSRNYHW